MSPRLTRGFAAFADWRRIAGTLALVLPPLLVLPLFVGEFGAHVLAMSAYYVILAASWNMLAGFTGQFSLAQHAFAAIGAYASGLLIYHLKTPLWLSIPLAVGAAAVGGFAIGRLSVGRLAVGRAAVGKLKVEELEIGRLNVRETGTTDAGDEPSRD